METVDMASPGLGEAAFQVTGQVKWFDLAKGYGFIKPSSGEQGDILLHQTCVRQSGFKTAFEGAKVTCEAVQGPRGLQAKRLLSLDTSSCPQPAVDQRTSRFDAEPRGPAFDAVGK